MGVSRTEHGETALIADGQDRRREPWNRNNWSGILVGEDRSSIKLVANRAEQGVHLRGLRLIARGGGLHFLPPDGVGFQPVRGFGPLHRWEN